MELTNAVACEVHRRVLEMVKVSAARYVSPQLLADARIKAVDMVAEDLIRCVLELMVPGKRHEIASVSTPRGWWDHLRHDHPRLQRLFGAPRYDWIVVSTTHVCPHVDVPWNRDWAPHMRFLDRELGAPR